MRPVITADEVARLDSASPVPEAELMERAGLAVALSAVRMGAAYGTRVVVLAGTGNNGGDGYVAARLLRGRGVDVAVRCLGFPKGDSSTRRALSITAAKAGVPIAPLGSPETADLVVDALFGVGFHGTLPDRVLPWVEHPAPVLAVDVPSGLDATTGRVEGAVFRATKTVTFHALKTGHLIGRGPDVSGAVEVADIGLEGERATWMLCEDGDDPVPQRARTAHKWAAGSAAVAGGSPGMAGAAMLAARAALEFGTGAVCAVLPGLVRAEAAAMDGAVMTAAAGSGATLDDPDAVLEAAQRFDVLALGPGLGQVNSDLVDRVAGGWDGPLVLDADALRSVSIDALKARTAPTVLTPHAGEFRALTGEEASPGAAAHLADRTGAVVLLKGAPTFVMGDAGWVVTSGGPELATIGTGDVLTGMIAALLARGADAETAARSAAHRHGRAAARLAAERTVTAASLVGTIGSFAG